MFCLAEEVCFGLETLKNERGFGRGFVALYAQEFLLQRLLCFGLFRMNHLYILLEAGVCFFVRCVFSDFTIDLKFGFG